MGKEDEIRLIAYGLWEEEGCPHGLDHEHWIRAEAIWEVGHRVKTPKKNIKATSRKTDRSSKKTK